MVGLLMTRTGLLLVAAWPFTVDDTYITLRYAKHLAAGRGIVWNLGEPPVEGYSNFLYVILGAAAHKLGLDPELGFKWLGILALAVSAAMLYRIARLWVEPLAALTPVILFTAFLGAVWWAVSGLETLTYVALVLAAVAAAFTGLGYRPVPAQRLTEMSLVWVAASGGLVWVAAMTHPEGPVIGLAIAAGIMMSRRGVRPMIVFAAAAGLPWAIYFAWRAAYFQRLLPNPVYCKGGYDGYPLWQVEDLASRAAPYLLLLAVAAWRRMDPRHLVAITLVLLYLGLLYDVDPILTQGARHGLAALAVLVAVASGTALARLSPARAAQVMLAALIVSSVHAYGLLSELPAMSRSYASRTAARLAIGDLVDRTLAPNESYVMGDVGAVTMRTERRMLDAYCLNSAEMTRPPIDRSGPRYARWLLAQEPRVIVMPSYASDSLAPHGYLGVFSAMAQDSQFRRSYTHVETIDVPGTIFHYWLFRRGHPQ